MKAATTNPPPVSLLACISIHAAREGGDWLDNNGYFFMTISIHAAREGGDSFSFVQPDSGHDFNPRRP